LPPAPVQIMADAEALTKVFDNLFSNAVKYGRRDVAARLLPPAGDTQELRFEISNDGCRIPPDMHEKIFEPFVRIKENNKQKGTGLGLALARSLVELHRGKIYVRESDSQYTTFIVEIPDAGNHSDKKDKTKKASYIS
jgi:signal transduction histidine kinase